MRCLLAAVAMASVGFAQTPASTAKRWWLDEPVRFFQTNLAETASTLDAKRLVQQVAEFPANALLFNMGGIVAQYPTRVPFHYTSRYMPPGRDLFGEIVQEAHARKMRVVGRFDLSKTQPPVFEAHPEWFFKRTTGEPVIYNGLYSVCINGGYYREHAAKILTEALERYAVDGLFFNMFGNPANDYSGVPMGPCQCDACQEGFRARFGRALPTNAQDGDYREFMTASARDVAAKIAELIHRVRPGAAFLTYIEDYTDVIMLESNTSVTRALPLWPYSASDNVNRSRTSEPGKGVFNLCMSFVDFPWRQVTVPQPEIQLRLYQNLAHGGPPAFVVVGTPDQEDRQAMIAAKPVFQWHAQNEELYAGQENAARVLLLTTGNQNSYRGFFRLLSEQHIPFAATGNLKWLDDPARRYDLVIAPSGAAPELERYVRAGGRLLIAGPTAPPATLPIVKVIGARPAAQGAWRIHDHALLPSLKGTNLLFLDGPYVELEPAPNAKPLLTLIPPAMFGPPEKVWVDKVETTIPGLVFAPHGEGRVAYIPWDVGGLYYRHGSQAHAALMTDVIDQLLPRGRQIKSNAHPLVEITVMRQPQRNRTLLHFVNLSGHTDTTYHPPIEMRDIAVELDAAAGNFTRARAMKLGESLRFRTASGRRAFTLPRLGAYEVVVLE
ncbi:MAG: alpha-amylase family protein [Opitutaceae bacterium]